MLNDCVADSRRSRSIRANIFEAAAKRPRQAEDHCLLSTTGLNLKRMVKRLG